jgi:hypothetical protein
MSWLLLGLTALGNDTELSAGKVHEGVLSVGRTDSYVATLEAGEFAQIAVDLHCAGIAATWDAKAPSEAFLLCSWMEEVRTALGLDDSSAATWTSHAAVGGGAQQGDRGR